MRYFLCFSVASRLSLNRESGLKKSSEDNGFVRPTSTLALVSIETPEQASLNLHRGWSGIPFLTTSGRSASQNIAVFLMKQVAEFHGRANDCLSMAARAESEIIRIQLEDLAKHWAELAQSRENLIKSQLKQSH